MSSYDAIIMSTLPPISGVAATSPYFLETKSKPSQESKISRIANSIFTAVKSCGLYIGRLFNYVNEGITSVAIKVASAVSSIFGRAQPAPAEAAPAEAAPAEAAPAAFSAYLYSVD